MPSLTRASAGLMVAAACVLLATAAAAGLDARRDDAQQPPLTFRAAVDLLMIDVQVMPAKRAPLRDLTPADFEIRIAGRERPAVSVTLLHYDTGTVVQLPMSLRPKLGVPACVFGFHRQADRTTAHYLVGVDARDTDRENVKQVRVAIADDAFVAAWWAWRSPARGR